MSGDDYVLLTALVLGWAPVTTVLLGVLLKVLFYTGDLVLYTGTFVAFTSVCFYVLYANLPDLFTVITPLLELVLELSLTYTYTIYKIHNTYIGCLINLYNFKSIPLRHSLIPTAVFDFNRLCLYCRSSCCWW